MADFRKKVNILAAAMVVAFACAAVVAEAQVHHVVGEDLGWDTPTTVESWAAGRIFTVGDFIWFTYSTALENIVELRSKEEFESCDLTNPIKMHTGGLDRVPLDVEGMRYFASGNPEHCKKGLKLPVAVLPKSTAQIKPLPIASDEATALRAAAPPVSPPSDSNRIKGPTSMLSFCGVLLLVYCMAPL
ncbi:hypothetical protein Ancab_004811 [Ancistrocladus abbreviatus]